jgi:hypothetical protein
MNVLDRLTQVPRAVQSIMPLVILDSLDVGTGGAVFAGPSIQGLFTGRRPRGRGVSACGGTSPRSRTAGTRGGNLPADAIPEQVGAVMLGLGQGFVLQCLLINGTGPDAYLAGVRALLTAAAAGTPDDGAVYAGRRAPACGRSAVCRTCSNRQLLMAGAALWKRSSVSCAAVKAAMSARVTAMPILSVPKNP